MTASAPLRASLRFVVAMTFAGYLPFATIILTAFVMYARRSWSMSIRTICASLVVGNVRMSRTSVRVKPKLPAPINAIRAMGSPDYSVTRPGNQASIVQIAPPAQYPLRPDSGNTPAAFRTNASTRFLTNTGLTAVPEFPGNGGGPMKVHRVASAALAARRFSSSPRRPRLASSSPHFPSANGSKSASTTPPRLWWRRSAS